jgi:multicomponent Na+:H+ antiporter subunit D
VTVAHLAPLPVALALLSAAALVPLAFLRRRLVIDATAMAVAVAVVVICAVLLWQSTSGPFGYAFGGWGLREGVPVGVSFVVDPFGAALAMLAAVLVVAALLFAWQHFETVGSHFHVLLLVVLAGMTGFALTADLFNMFVFFELLSIAAYALTGYEIERARPVEGALNFAVTNSLGAFLVLAGIGLVYARTGALNIAQIGRVLSGHGADGLVVVAFTLIVTGFLVKAAVVPFHFWLADAHAVAPTPMSIVLSAAMVQLGLYAVARLYWMVFEAPLALAGVPLRPALVALGVVTAVVGACMCFAQEHVKRLLAFSTVSHSGLFLIGVGVLDPVGLAGAGISVVAHGFVKAALFVCSGVLVHRYGTVDENRLHGRGRELPVTGTVFALAGVALAGLPPFGAYLGKALIEEATASAGYGWVTPLALVTSALTGGAVLRLGGRVFLGWGPRNDEAFESHQAEDEVRETEDDRRVPPVMMAPAVALLVAAFAWGLVPGLVHRAEVGAEAFVDRDAYASAAFGDDPAIATPPPREAPAHSAAFVGVLSAVAALVTAALGLFRRHLVPATLRAWVAGAVNPGLSGLRGLHSGHVGDYVTWLVVGVSLLGGWLALAPGS